MESQREKKLREIAHTDDVYIKDPEHIIDMTRELTNNGIFIYQWFMLGINDGDNATKTVMWMIPREGLILDLGSGTGYVAALMKQVLPALDFTLLNINKFQLHAMEDNFPAERTLWNMRELPLPYPDKHFSNVMMNYSLGHAGSLDELFPEIFRILDNNGVLFIQDIFAREDEAFAKDFHYVTYIPTRVVEAAQEAGFSILRCGTPFPVIFQEKVMNRDKFLNLYKASPVIYCFVKLTK